MKILYVVHKFLPRYFSGTEIYTYNLAQEMHRRGHTVQVFCAEDVEKGPAGCIEARDDTYNGLKVHRISFDRKKTPDIIRFAYNNPMVAGHLQSYLSTDPPDVVHITSFLNLSASIIGPIKSYPLPAVFTATDFWSFCPKSNFLAFDLSLCARAEPAKCLACIISLARVYDTLLRRIKVSPLLTASILYLLSYIPGLRSNPYIRGRVALEERPHYLKKEVGRLDLVVTPNQFLRDFFLDMGLEAQKVLVSEFGINTQWIKPHDKRSLEEPIRFGYIGILAQLKGVEILIRSFLKVAPSSLATLAIYGDSSHYPNFAQSLLALADKSPAICFMGTFAPERLGEVLAEIDVLVVPSLWYENNPLVISSALAAGVPVVASDVPGIFHLVNDGVNGFLFRRGNEEALTRCLRRLAEDPGILSALRCHSAPVKSITENGAELESHYLNLVEGGVSGVQESTTKGIT